MGFSRARSVWKKLPEIQPGWGAESRTAFSSETHWNLAMNIGETAVGRGGKGLC